MILELSACYDAFPIKVAHIVLGRLCIFYERVQHDGYENTYTLVHNGCKKILRPMKEIPPHQQSEEKLASLKPRALSNTPTKKQFKVTSKEEEIANDESRMQKVMEPILEQLVGKLKEVVKASEEPVLEFPRQNIIMIGGKHEESYDIIRIAEISFEYREFKNLILPQDNLQEECGKQLSTSLLMTQLFRELSTCFKALESFSTFCLIVINS